MSSLLDFSSNARANQRFRWKIPENTKQLVVVLSEEWDSSKGRLIRLKRGQDISVWEAVDEHVPVILGRNGLGWGRGLHPSSLPGPTKREGDGRAPAGLFRLSQAFATQPDREVPAFPLLISSDNHYCVDDTNSPFYNEIIRHEEGTEKLWKSAEAMRHPDGLYDLGIIVEHNRTKPQSGAGSCIFLHIWRSPAGATDGCTGLSRESLAELLGWLSETDYPLLLQLPKPALLQLTFEDSIEKLLLEE